MQAKMKVPQTFHFSTATHTYTLSVMDLLDMMQEILQLDLRFLNKCQEQQQGESILGIQHLGSYYSPIFCITSTLSSNNVFT